MNRELRTVHDFCPTASWDVLRRRAALLQRLRNFFNERGFLEVETPLLSADTVVDRHLDPLAVTLCDNPRVPDRGRRLWLQTSPEFCMKRLLAAGSGPIFQVTRAFRAAEQGALHNPEFTIVEWYRVGDDMRAGMQLLSQLSEALLGAAAADAISYRDAFRQAVGLDPLAATVEDLRRACRDHQVDVTDLGADREAWLNVLLAARVEPTLGQQRPTIIYDYPADQSALARVREDDPPVAERFELYFRGIELANGYNELVDPVEFQRRCADVNQQRAADGKPRLPERSRLLDAMQHGLPACTGVALGFDRLVMLATGAKSLAEVMAFPIERA